MTHTWWLQGPFPFDPNNVGAAGRAALRAAEAASRAPDGALRPFTESGQTPGLYVLWRDTPGGPGVAGFWIVFGAAYTVHGPLGPPDREPPFARDLLGAATEEVWWRNLRVAPLDGITWRPWIVLEWLPELASRSQIAPPGSPEAPRPTVLEEDRGDWLSTEELPKRLVPVTAELEDEDTAFLSAIPPRRSLVFVVRGSLSADRNVHRGSFAAVPLDALRGAGDPQVQAFDAWSEAAVPGPPTAGDHARGGPLQAPAGRVAFPLSGWLTRSLTLWPPRPPDIKSGTLHERDVGSRVRAQLNQILVVTTSVVVAVLYLALVVEAATTPRARVAPTTTAPAPQPAMSVCSPDHAPFIDELRCQIRHFASGGAMDVSVCGDPDAPEPPIAAETDLQAAYCGLRDRARDGDGAAQDAWSELAAAKACFNVLGHPYTYVRDGRLDLPGSRRADPRLFLHDPDLGIRGLVEMVAELDATCDAYATRLERQLEGAVVATHIGADSLVDTSTDDPPEPSRLRRLVVGNAVAGMPADEAGCFMSGSQAGVGLAATYDALCGGVDAFDRRAADSKAWQALAGPLVPEAPPVVARYALARFGTGAPSDPLWECHADLTSDAGGAAIPVLWDLATPIPTGYRLDGVVDSQLLLDATLRAIQEGVRPSACWDVMARRLARYQPVHPVLGAELDAGGWPSPEQQLCGQICAGYYGLREAPPADQWVTRGADLATCVDRRAPAASPATDDGFDTLRLPWNTRRGASWVAPEAHEVCAFHLVAQGYMPPAVLTEALPPPLWAGETAGGSRRAGGPEGAATKAAASLSSYGRARSVRSCGYVATQCFVSGMLQVMGDPSAEPYEWDQRWARWTQQLVGARGDAITPWCELVQPYLASDGTLPEGQLDYPCAKGVEDARIAVADALRDMTSDLHAAAETRGR